MSLILLLACTRYPTTGDTSGPADSGEPETGPLLFEGQAFYAGDPHAHTGFSGDGEAQGAACADCGTFDAAFDYARAVGLSWVAFTDHVNGYPANTAEGFAQELAAVEAANSASLVTIPGAEVWFRGPTGDLGHKTLLLFGDDVGGLTIDDVRPNGESMDVTACDDVWAWATRLEALAGPLLLVPHHPAGIQPMPTDWRCADEIVQPVVEMYSEQGNGLGDGTGYDPPWSGELTVGTVHYAMDPEGLALEMGFIAGTDAHDTLPGEVCGPDRVRTDQPYGGGLTIAVLPADAELTRSTLLDAFRTRSVYATSGPIVPMDVAWSAGGERLGGLGEDITVPTGEALEVTVRVPEAWANAVTSVELVGPRARVAATAEGDGEWSLYVGDPPAWLYAAITLDGEAIYGSSGCDDGGSTTDERVWGSPSWFY